jgi:hypothetical protein
MELQQKNRPQIGRTLEVLNVRLESGAYHGETG